MSQSDNLKTKGRPRAFDREQALLKALNIFWRKGYELSSVAELCAAMEINPPSLYAAFGNKEQLFIEAIEFYEQTYWEALWAGLSHEPCVYTAIKNLFNSAVAVLLSPEAPCGCLVVLSAINVAPESALAFESAQRYRLRGGQLLEARLKQGVDDGQLPKDTDIALICTVLHTLLAGLSIQVKDGADPQTLANLGEVITRLLPPPAH